VVAGPEDCVSETDDHTTQDAWVFQVFGLDMRTAATPHPTTADAADPPAKANGAASTQSKPGGDSLKAALAGWTKARDVAVKSLTQLEKAIRGMNDPLGDSAIMLVRAIRANLTVTPDTENKVIELQNYLTTDPIIDDAELENGFGIDVQLRTPLLAALAAIDTALKPQSQK
jgi:hypothetical protein